MLAAALPRAGLRASARAPPIACRCSARAFSVSARRANEAPAPATPSAPADPKLVSIVDQVEKLTLLEASSLVTLLKERLNITDISMPVSAAAPGAAPAAAPAEEAEEEEKPKEKTIFAIKLKGLKDAGAKAKVIKEVKALNSSMSLVEAKKFVEGAPQILKDNVPKEDADKIIAAIEKAGGEAELV